jgi:hypothetical protein
MRTEIEFLWAVRKPETRPDQNRAEILPLGLATDEQDQNLVGALSRMEKSTGSRPEMLNRKRIQTHGQQQLKSANEVETRRKMSSTRDRVQKWQ